MVNELPVRMHVLWEQVFDVVDIRLLCAGSSGTSTICGTGRPRSFRRAYAIRSGYW